MARKNKIKAGDKIARGGMSTELAIEISAIAIIGIVVIAAVIWACVVFDNITKTAGERVDGVIAAVGYKGVTVSYTGPYGEDKTAKISLDSDRLERYSIGDGVTIEFGGRGPVIIDDTEREMDIGD